MVSTIFIAISAIVMVYLSINTNEELDEWNEEWRSYILILYGGICFGNLMFLISLGKDAKWNSRYRNMKDGEYVSCAIGIYVEILVCVALSLCIIFAQFADER